MCTQSLAQNILQAEDNPPGTTLQTDSVSLEVMIGQMIITGIGDFSYITEKEEILTEIEKGYITGVVLFEKNINKNSPEKQLKRTIDMLQSKSSIPLFISIDEEGGRVNRLKPKYGFPATTTAQNLGETDNLDSTRFYANKTASLLADLGININLAPNVDVNVNPKNPVIGGMGRSYSSDEKIVAKHAAQVIRTHHENGVLTVLKHFPGHGSSHADTHLGIADVTDYWQFRELMPYKYLIDSALADGIMTAHIINGHLDENKLPATLSPFIINNILRNVLGYNGVVFSDDMQMHAISKHYGFEQSLKMAIDAGVDVLMFANMVEENERKTASQIHSAILNMVNSGDVTQERIATSYRRIIKMKSSL
ncbi:glycoside hydrolase family 3 N-terminal domain-containing protein [Reichenbachiella sp. MALMAid0571]|uniref:glycoside hydrolase family 3 protein n=1 Tax=Reichenbachiella sp. MALMAid0571 TaxID=3143939 RepID=UPI0032DEA3C1